MDDKYIEPQENLEIDTPTDLTPDDNNLPFETIKLNPTYDDILEQHKHINRGALVFMCAVFLLFVVWDIYSIIRYGLSESVTPCVISIVLLLFILMLNNGSRANAKAQYEKAEQGTSSLSFFDDHIEYAYKVGDSLHTFFRIDPKAITGAKALCRSLVFRHEGMCFIIPKTDIPENSKALEMIFASRPDVKSSEDIKKIINGKQTNGSNRTTAIIVLSIVSVVVLIASVFLTDLIFGPLWWLPIVCLAIPIVALSLTKGQKFKGKGSAITIAIVSIVLLGIIGLATVGHTFLGTSTENAEKELSRISEVVGIDIPQIYDGGMYEDSVYDEETKTYLSYTNTYAWLDENANENFRKTVEQSGLWISSLDTETADFFDEIFNPQYCDAFLIYNVTENTYNQLPTTNNECEYIIIIYEYTGAYIDVYVFNRAYNGNTTSVPDTIVT